MIDLDLFRVGGLDDESGMATEPVELTCTICGESKWFTYRDDGGANRTELLSVIVGWAELHGHEHRLSDLHEAVSRVEVR